MAEKLYVQCFLTCSRISSAFLPKFFWNSSVRRDCDITFEFRWTSKPGTPFAPYLVHQDSLRNIRARPSTSEQKNDLDSARFAVRQVFPEKFCNFPILTFDIAWKNSPRYSYPPKVCRTFRNSYESMGVRIFDHEFSSCSLCGYRYNRKKFPFLNKLCMTSQSYPAGK